MKVGDEVIYIDDKPYNYPDDLYWDEYDFQLNIINIQYQIFILFIIV